MTTKAEFEEMCRKADMEPVMRGGFSVGDVLIADGFTRNPYKNFRKFGMGMKDFPSGCYATLWALFKDDEFLIADAVFFDPLHDLSLPNRRDARVRVAMERAEKVAEAWEHVRKNPISEKEAEQTEEFFREQARQTEPERLH